MRNTETAWSATIAANRTAVVVYVVDDDSVREALTGLLRSIDLEVDAFRSAEEFLAAPKGPGPACLVLDVRLRGQGGLALQKSLLTQERAPMPVVFMTGYGDIAMTVEAMKAGALDFLTKPFRDQDMIDAVVAALQRDARRLEADSSLFEARERWGALTPREREVLVNVASGLMNKQIASRMRIAEVEANGDRFNRNKRPRAIRFTDQGSHWAFGIPVAPGADISAYRVLNH